MESEKMNIQESEDSHDISIPGKSDEPSVKVDYDKLPWTIAALEAKYAIPPVTEELPEKIFASDSEDEDTELSKKQAKYCSRISSVKDVKEKEASSAETVPDRQVQIEKSEGEKPTDDQLCRMMADPFAMAGMTDEELLRIYNMDTDKALYSYPFQWDKTMFDK